MASPFKSKIRLEAENAVLRHRLIVLRRKMCGRVQLANGDRWFFVQLFRWFPSILKVLTIIRLETLVRWHRAGFRRYWHWKSRSLGGRPQIETELRALIPRMGVENPLWARHASTENFSSLGLRSPNQASPSTWSSGVDRRARNGELSFAITPQISRPWTCSLSRLSVSTCFMPSSSSALSAETGPDQCHNKPTAEWIARQITEAFPWNEAPRYIIRDRDRIYGAVVTLRLRAMGIRDKPTAPASPWQNGFAERLIGSIRRECLDHIVVFGEAHLRRILRSYAM